MRLPGVAQALEIALTIAETALFAGTSIIRRPSVSELGRVPGTTIGVVSIDCAEIVWSSSDHQRAEQLPAPPTLVVPHTCTGLATV